MLPLLVMASIACTFEPPPPSLRLADAASPDAGQPSADASVADAGAVEAGADAAVLDAKVTDAHLEDAEPPDAEPGDVRPEDAEPVDAEPVDAEPADAERVDGGGVCGDGVVVAGEGCDDGDRAPGDGCNAGCNVEVGWSCIGSPSLCTEVCGDGRVVGAEPCDDGAVLGGDGCSVGCEVELGWSCDASQPTRCAPICGDGFVRGGETCDDGAIQPNDGCSPVCWVEPGYRCEGEPSTCVPWWNQAYLMRRSITVDRTGIGEDLTNFPVLVRLDAQRIDYAAEGTGGASLRFVADDQSTLLVHEVEAWDAGGSSYVWVRWPAIHAEGSTAAPDRIWMYFDGPATGAPPVSQVWSAGYEAVWHLGERPQGAPGEVQDSSGHLRDGTTLGGMTAAASVPGRVGAGLQFDGLDDLIDFGPIDAGAWDAITLEAQVRWTGSFGHVLSEASGVLPSDHVFSLEVSSGTTATSRLSSAGVGASDAEASGGSITPGTWHYLASSWSAAGGTLSIYLDGVEVASALLGGDQVESSTVSAVLGNVDIADARHLEGTIDEVRISRVARSSDWFEAQARSMSDALLLFGPPQSL